MLREHPAWQNFRGVMYPSFPARIPGEENLAERTDRFNSRSRVGTGPSAICRNDQQGGTSINVIRSLWASIQGDPVFMRRVSGWLTVFWLVMIPVSLLTGWISSVTYVAALSLWALVSGHWWAWQAARVEVRQDEEARRAAEEPVEERIVDRLVEQTNVDAVASG
jgi:hypothetical protein